MDDPKAKLYGREKPSTKPSEDKSQIEEGKRKSKEEKHVEFDSKLEISPDSNVEPTAMKESVEEKSYPYVEDSSDKVIPADISLPSQFLLPNLDDSSSNEETEITELNTEAEIHDTNNEEEMLSVNSEASSLVNTNELLEFIDTMDMDKSENTKQSDMAVSQKRLVYLKQILENRLLLTLNQRVNLAHSCLTMKVSHLQWIQVQRKRS